MTTISAKELRQNLSDYLLRSGAGEEIEVLYRSRRLVRIVPIKTSANRYRGDQVGKRLDQLMKNPPVGVSDTLRNPNKDYKQLRNELYRKSPKYSRYLTPKK